MLESNNVSHTDKLLLFGKQRTRANSYQGECRKKKERIKESR